MDEEPSERTKSIELSNFIQDNQILTSLHRFGVSTVRDFILVDRSQLLTRTSLSLPDVNRIFRQIYSTFGSPHVLGHNLYHHLVALQKNIPYLTHTPLDPILGGGIFRGDVIELVGQQSSGKTQCCLSFLASLVTKYDLRALFIDSTNSFSSERILPLLRSQCQPNPPGFEEADVLNNIERLLCYNINDLLRTLDALLESQPYQLGERVDIVFIDSLSFLLSPVITPNMRGHTVMSHVTRRLRRLANNALIPIIYTNHTVSTGQGGGVKPALGDAWAYTPDIQIMLQESASASDITERLATIRKGKRTRTGISTKFRIALHGIY
eukprot:TRINITY_DN15823_c0_g1::TRINITY_DN15823_c0_g1_i1::g.25544::m.25544 TRINITY_DN15823_c0_g1::TRINITY_DN15823_c0_g1_i1::g.25544  ORF type:complete len:324 (-),score=30.69,sp/O55230/RA51D_MOUSE/27.09/3e-28,Rad51/PF08423.6/5.2e-10,AAA_25/PF13481.1/4e-07,KaiC/PF06745.8/1.6e-05,KaiC/PF06745.8/1.2e+03,RecA/PF00154.16/1.6e-05,RecA/PF00154.16/1.6e+03,DnaB_C/PF03796.10/4.3,DnaB_C/PF03796.10/0.13,AAA_22/PF13401.1/2.4e+02,AAA_22/PF13401.1/0.011 TRINITY_DN15823_c0_g1_i1:62-1033(-)